MRSRKNSKQSLSLKKGRQLTAFLEEEKDFLLEKFRVVKGDVKYLSPDIKSLMLHFEKSKYGFTFDTCRDMLQSGEWKLKVLFMTNLKFDCYIKISYPAS